MPFTLKTISVGQVPTVSKEVYQAPLNTQTVINRIIMSCSPTGNQGRLTNSGYAIAIREKTQEIFFSDNTSPSPLIRVIRNNYIYTIASTTISVLDMCFDQAEDILYFTEGSRIRKINLTVQPYAIQDVAGTTTNGTNNNSNPLLAQFGNNMYSIAFNSDYSFLYVADTSNRLIRRIAFSSGGTIAGAVSTFAGNGSLSNSDNTTGINASFINPVSIAVHPTNGNIYVTADNQIRVISISGVNPVTTITMNPSIANSPNSKICLTKGGEWMYLSCGDDASNPSLLSNADTYTRVTARSHLSTGFSVWTPLFMSNDTSLNGANIINESNGALTVNGGTIVASRQSTSFHNGFNAHMSQVSLGQGMPSTGLIRGLKISNNGDIFYITQSSYSLSTAITNASVIRKFRHSSPSFHTTIAGIPSSTSNNTTLPSTSRDGIASIMGKIVTATFSTGTLSCFEHDLNPSETRIQTLDVIKNTYDGSSLQSIYSGLTCGWGDTIKTPPLNLVIDGGTVLGQGEKLFLSSSHGSMNVTLDIIEVTP
jgi:hypothetical protein